VRFNVKLRANKAAVVTPTRVLLMIASILQFHSRSRSRKRCRSGSQRWLVDQRQVDWQSRAHFFGVPAQVMRRILVDHARGHSASKRGDGVQCVSIDEAKEAAAPDEMPILALDHAPAGLEKEDAGLAKIVELRAFSTDQLGLTLAAHFSVE